jgi:hypothetical protein
MNPSDFALTPTPELLQQVKELRLALSKPRGDPALDHFRPKLAKRLEIIESELELRSPQTMPGAERRTPPPQARVKADYSHDTRRDPQYTLAYLTAIAMQTRKAAADARAVARQARHRISRLPYLRAQARCRVVWARLSLLRQGNLPNSSVGLPLKRTRS